MSAKPIHQSVRPNRDSVTTIREDGSRFFLHPADARGFWTRARRGSALFLIAIYLSLPWIPVGGYPAVFLDVANRRFHLFGQTLAFQDAWLLFFVITGLGFGLFFITALLGRVWCGWACPQTVFLEHVFRRMERWIEGDAVARRRLDAAPWTQEKILKRAGKHVAFVVLAAVITHLLLAYFVSLPGLWEMMKAAPTEHWSAFAFVGLATGVLYFNFAWFREQLCLVICPYGRLQSVLIDDHSQVIGYDAKRGNPPSPRLRRTQPLEVGDPGVPAEALAKAGACIDCNRCVQVCPTGIDIRQGLQIECIACAACIDACDTVMDKLERPRGLVRYDSTAGFAGGKTRWLRPQLMVYAVLLAAGASVATWALTTVRPASLGVTRLGGAPYFIEATTVRNQFLVRLVNKHDVPEAFRITTEGGVLHQDGFEDVVTLAPLGEEVRPLVLSVQRADYTGPFRFTVVARPESGGYELRREVEFTGPNAALLKDYQP